MDFESIVKRRAHAGAGVYLALTRRCPLSCAHCSTNSTIASEELPRDVVLRFVASFTHENAPDHLWLTGGEPLIRPGLVRDIAAICRPLGTNVIVGTGLFFATLPKIPRQVWDAIKSVDFVAVSIDQFHEREVPRESSLAAIRTIREEKPVGIHITVLDEDDPYLASVTASIHEVLGAETPTAVNFVRPIGRAREWWPSTATKESGASRAVRPYPCSFASWPVVGFKGTIAACCNQDVVDDPPEHLRIGDIRDMTWTEVREVLSNRPILRMIRTVGPRVLAQTAGISDVPEMGFCEACRQLSKTPSAAQQAHIAMADPSFVRLEGAVAELQHDSPEVLATLSGVPQQERSAGHAP